jgi:hypothetical protein
VYYDNSITGTRVALVFVVYYTASAAFDPGMLCPLDFTTARKIELLRASRPRVFVMPRIVLSRKPQVYLAGNRGDHNRGRHWDRKRGKA